MDVVAEALCIGPATVTEPAIEEPRKVEELEDTLPAADLIEAQPAADATG
jgi:hypothetical protein